MILYGRLKPCSRGRAIKDLTFSLVIYRLATNMLSVESRRIHFAIGLHDPVPEPVHEFETVDMTLILRRHYIYRSTCDFFTAHYFKGCIFRSGSRNLSYLFRGFFDRWFLPIATITVFCVGRLMDICRR